jgi:dephospho-CoA kinase
MILVGITGTHGAGKGTITQHLCDRHDFVCRSVSEFLAEEAKRRGMYPDRTARHTIANEYRYRGPRALMEAVFATIPKDTARVVLEPQYTPEEVRFIHEKGGVVIALDANVEIRYKRVHVRGSAKDDVSFEEFRSAEEREMEAARSGEQNLRATMQEADALLINDAGIDELIDSVDAFLKHKDLI